MADTSTLTAAQITAATQTTPTKTLVPAVTKAVVFTDTSYLIYYSSNSPQGAGWRVQVTNAGVIVADVRIVDIPSTVLSGTDKQNLAAIGEKMHVGFVQP